MTTAQQLSSVQTLIANIEAAGAAGYSEAGQSFTYQDLATLYAREKSLLARLNAESGTQFALIDPITD